MLLTVQAMEENDEFREEVNELMDEILLLLLERKVE
jgi:hypothetical protein